MHNGERQAANRNRQQQPQKETDSFPHTHTHTHTQHETNKRRKKINEAVVWRTSAIMSQNVNEFAAMSLHGQPRQRQRNEVLIENVPSNGALRPPPRGFQYIHMGTYFFLFRSPLIVSALKSSRESRSHGAASSLRPNSFRCKTIRSGETRMETKKTNEKRPSIVRCVAIFVAPSTINHPQFSIEQQTKLETEPMSRDVPFFFWGGKNFGAKK